MTRTQRIVTAALAAIVAAIILLWTPAQETWGQGNTPPVIGIPTSTPSQYLFPRGEKAVLEFSSEPVTDTVWFVFTVPDISTPDNNTDTTKTNNPAEALFKVTPNGNNFEFTAKDGVTPEDFTALYGNVVSHKIPVKMYAKDSSDQESDPLSFTITAYHDASPQFHHSATYQSKQRWDTDTVIEVYEGPQNVTDALQIPWTSTTEGARTWTLGNRDGTMDSPKVKCKDQSGTTTHTWDDQGSQDSALVAIDQPQGDQQKGHIPLRFASTPDYEAAQDDGTNNEYLIRLASGHNIHELGTTDETLGCDGSALDLKIRVKDVGPPAAPPTGLTLTLEARKQDQFGIYWDTPHANQFIEDGTRVDFPDPSFNIKSIVISHEPNGLQYRDNPLRNPSTLSAKFGGIEHVKGTPGVTYTITTKLRNSEGDSTSVSEQITLPGPPATPEAPTVRPEGDTSVTAAWKEPDDDGGSPITGYEVQYQKDDAPAWTEWPHTETGTSATITGLEETSTYNVHVKAKNNMGASDWSPTGTGRTAGLVVQITSAGNITSGNDAVFTVTLSKADTVTVNLTHAWTGEYGDSTSGTLEFTDETSKNYTLTTARGNPGPSGGSVTVTIDIDTNAAYAIGTGGSATVNIEQDPSSQPTLAPPSNQGSGAVYKFPAGKTDGIKYNSEPGTDQDGDTLAYLITFTNPKTDNEETITILADGTAADLPGTLLTIERSGHNFIFEPDGNVTPDQFETTYGNLESHHEEKTLEVQLWASDGTERSPPVDFTLRLHYDPSGYFPQPAENRSISRWDLPGAIETSEGTSTLSGATVMWASPLAGARNWATGNPTTPVSCRHGLADQDNTAWPAAGNEDSDLFTLDTSTTTDDSGSITFSFKDPPDFESPSDSDKDNTYRLRLHNIHSLHQATGDQVWFPACSGSAIDITVIVINVNEPPKFPSETDDRSVTENTAAGQDIGTPVSATDPDTGDTLTYALDGTDAASFDIDLLTGQLQTKADLDFEEKTSYTVTVTATDSSDASDTIRVTITVTNVDEPPTLTGDSNINYAENGSETVADYTAVDPEGTSITWSLSGDDSDQFSITGGVLTFSSSSSPPDYETPTDADPDNIYLVTVLASDGANTASMDVTVTVTDENETPSVSGQTSISYEENRTDTVATYTASDPEGTSVTWSLSGDDAEDFVINEGVLTFGATPNFEDAADTNTNNVYRVEVRASNGPNTGTLDVTITVTDENEPPVFAEETVTRTIEENTEADQNVGTPVSATDQDAGETLIYTLGGTDATSFSIIESTSQLQTKANLDFENKASYTVTVTATDSSDASDTITVTITVTDENETSEFPSTETGTRSMAENTVAGEEIGAAVAAIDPDTGDTLTYTLEGTDLDSFDIDSASGQIQTKSGVTYDHEIKSSYSVTVKADDNNGGTATIDVTITVADVNEPPEFSVETASRTIAENTTTGVAIGAPVTATDPDTADTPAYTLRGTNATFFDIDASTGQLQTKAAMDYETKSGYTVTVTASDGTLTATLDVTVTVTNIDEAGTVTLSTDRPPARAEITAALTDPDEGISGTVWQWERSSDGNTAWAGIGAGTPSYTPVDGDVGYHLRATASYTDGHGPSKTAQGASTQTVQAGANRPPELESATATREVPENTAAGGNIGAPFLATDPDTGDTLTYSLGGTDAASFGIIESTGQLQTKNALDFEIKSTYTVTVTATDQGSLSDITTVTVTVTNVDETPMVAGNSPIDYPENDTTDVATYTADDPENGQITWDLLGNDNSLFSISTSGVLTFNTPPDYETPASADHDNEYLVTVQASDGPNTDTQPVTVTVTNVNEPPTFTQETATRTIAENTAENQNIGAPFLATDPDAGNSLTYSLGGNDAASFGIITTSGQLQTKADLDFEEKASYTVTVTATDQGSLSDITTVTITVTNVDETPTVTGDSSINYAENGSEAVAAYMAADPEKSEITWSLSGEDSGDFSISNAGLINFDTPPDYETPKDMDSDNEYLVNVLASDGANTASLDVTITVTDENETSVVAGNSLIDYPENSTGPVATYTADDPENSQITWSLSGDDSRHFSISSAGVLTFNTPPDYETPADTSTNNVYLVEIRASDGPNTDTQAVAVTVTNVNEPPAFAAETAASTIAENTEAGQNIGTPVSATDPDAGETLTYSLGGTDAASLDIIESTGQLQTKAAPGP